MMQNDVVVIGGGISGLSLAYYCVQAGMKTTLLEKNESLGGSFASPQYSSNGKKFWMELGAHTCYSSYQNLLDIVEGCGVTNTIIPRAKVPFTLFVDGKIRSIVSQLNILELLVSVPNLFKLKKTGLSVRSYYSKIVGEKNYEEVIRHFFNAVPSQQTDNFPADMMFKSRPKRKDVLKNYTFQNGLQSVARAIAAKSGLNVFTSQDVNVWSTEEFEHIARTQNSMENALAEISNGLVINDTNAFATGLWHERYLGTRSKIVEDLERACATNLYIVTGDEIPFVQDGLRDGEHIRHKMHLRFIERLEEDNKPYIVVTGTPEQRLQSAIKAIDQL